VIRFDNVSKIFRKGQPAVVNLSLEVEQGQTLVLLGTSGSGKTTTMKMVNRLVEPTVGRVLVNGEDVMRQDPITLRRSIGYAIQDIGLFPHMTVADNVAVVPRLAGWPEERIDARIDELMTMVGMGPTLFRDRYPSQLSGGQRQRIGVARALAADPPIVLMDEPFGALDPITREELQNEFLELQSEIEKTIIFVTHDVFEAVKIGDRIAMLDAGALQQVATPRELARKPANEFVDRFLGRHRFQLSLLTRTVGTEHASSLSAAEPPRQPPKVFLTFRSSLVDALDEFNATRSKTLAVYDHGTYLGNLGKQDLLQSIARAAGEPRGSA
jgi:osmoprotectant transport system ATP-binding protein